MIWRTDLESVDVAGGTVLEAEAQILHAHAIQCETIDLQRIAGNSSILSTIKKSAYQSWAGVKTTDTMTDKNRLPVQDLKVV
jgi:hypothetical protein